MAKESRLASGRTFCDGWKVSMRMSVGRTGWVGEGCGRARAEWSAGHAWLAAEWRAGVVGLSWRGREGLELGGCSALSKQDRRNKSKSREDLGKSFVLRKSRDSSLGCGRTG